MVVPPRLIEGGAEAGRGGRVGERAVDPPPGGGAEPHAGPLALDHHPRGHALHPAGGQARHHLAPEHGRDLVAVETVEDAPRLLRVDQTAVEVAPLVHGAGDRGRRDLVEHHPLDRDGRRQHLGQVPRDRLALAVFVRCQVELVGALEELLQVGHHRLLRRRDDVERLEAVVDVDAQARPALTLVGGRDLVGAAGQVADVTDRRLDDEVGSEHPADGARLGRRLDDDERLTHGSPPAGSVGCGNSVGMMRHRVRGSHPPVKSARSRRPRQRGPYRVADQVNRPRQPAPQQPPWHPRPSPSPWPHRPAWRRPARPGG